MDILRIGTRGSRLALAQAGWVASLLRERCDDLTVQLVPIRTSGDIVKDVPLGPEHGRSFFTKQIEEALLAGDVDLAVHSCKDVAARLPAGLVLAAFPAREDPRDVLVSRSGGLDELPAGASVGTSSPRRKGFLLLARPDLVVQEQRGNVPTRVRAVDDGAVDAVVLAAAGLLRLGMGDLVREYLDPSVMLPATGQGALALQAREADDRVVGLAAELDDRPTRAAVEAERACLRRLEAGCQAPVGALARVDADAVTLEAAVVTPQGVIRARVSGPASEPPRELGERVAERVLEQLGLDSLRDSAWAGPPPRRTQLAR